jgi:putative ABC transport system permease protein
LLRALGVSKAQVRCSIGFESVIIALTGTIVGITAGVGLAVVAQLSLTVLGLTRLTFPWLWILALAGLAMIIGVVAPSGPALRASRVPVLGTSR